MNLEPASNILPTSVSTSESLEREEQNTSQPKVYQLASSTSVQIKFDQIEEMHYQSPIEKRVVSSKDLKREERLLELGVAIQESWSMPKYRHNSGFVGYAFDPFNPFNPFNPFKPHFFISNEFPNSPGVGTPKLNFPDTIQAIGQKKVVAEESLRIAMLVGESSLLASLPELANSCEMVLLTDYDEELLFCLLDQIKYIKECSEITDEPWYLNQVDKNITSPFNEFTKDYKKSRQALLELHPFSSVQRLRAVKEAIDKVKIVPVPIDLFSNLRPLADMLNKHNAEIQVINLSNVYEGASEEDIREHVIKLLPLSETALCADSFLRKGKDNQTRVFSSKKAYLDALVIYVRDKKIRSQNFQVFQSMS